MNTLRLHYGVVALAFAVSAAITVHGCGGQDCMTWMQGLPGFLGMWLVMMMAMMLPALAPWLVRHRRPLRAAAEYFAVWLLVGAALYPLGAWLTQALQGGAGAAVLLAAGAWQLTPWKRRQLARCREGCSSGFHHGLRCVACCANLNAVLLVMGLMDLRAMALVTAAITAERLSGARSAVPQALGWLLLGAGAFRAL